MKNIHPSTLLLYQHINKNPSSVLKKIQKNFVTINHINEYPQNMTQNSLIQRPKQTNKRRKLSTFSIQSQIQKIETH